MKVNSALLPSNQSEIRPADLMLIFNVKYYNILKENVQLSLKLESILHITDLFYLFIDIFILIRCIDIGYIYINCFNSIHRKIL